MPTAVPIAALSETPFADASVSEIAEMLVSLTSLTPIEKVSVVVEPSVDVAVTSMLWLVAVSASRPEATVTTPVFASMLKSPPALSERLYVTVSVASASVARAVMPTTAPTLASSSTLFASVFVSVIAETPDSLMLSTLIANVCVDVEPSSEVAVTSIEWFVAVS